MFARARRFAIAALLVAGCSGSDSGDDVDQNADPSSMGDGDSGDGDGDGDTGDGDGDQGDGDQGDGDQPDPNDPCGNGKEPLVPGLALKEISVYQVVKVPIFQNGAWLTSRVAPLIQNKKSLVRAFVEPQAGYTPHGVRGVLTIDNNGAIKTIVDEANPTGPSDETVSGSTFNFQVEAGDIGESTRFSVALVEKTCPSELGSPSLARFPQSGTEALQARKVGKLRVQVVPVKLANGLVPPTTEGQLEQIRTTFLALYPVSEVEVSVHQTVSWDDTLDARGSGWGELLQGITSLREQDNAPDDLYYYGLIMPAATIQDFCSQGCVLGLAPGQTSPDPSLRGALGIGYEHPETYLTIAHEVAHTHGRLHSPCAPGGQIQGIDYGYPNSTADTDTWGWDSRNNELKKPTSKDFMSYCTPTWVSAYTYNALAVRSNLVNKSLHAKTPWRRLVVDAAGRSSWGHTTMRTPTGARETAIVRNNAGKQVAEIQVVRNSLDDVNGAFITMPEPEASWASVVLHDREIMLHDIRTAIPKLKLVP